MPLIWSFACVAYEMFTGKKAFDGENVTDILASIVKSEPDWDTLPDGISLAGAATLEACLAKERQERLQDIGDAMLELKEPVPIVGAAANGATTLTSSSGCEGMEAATRSSSSEDPWKSTRAPSLRTEANSPTRRTRDEVARLLLERGARERR